MSKKKQVSKNLDLTEKLASFIVKHPDTDTKFSKGSVFVAFSATDKRLNKENLKLATNLNKDGKKVIKATETKNKTKPWNFSVALT